MGEVHPDERADSHEELTGTRDELAAPASGRLAPTSSTSTPPTDQPLVRSS